MKYLYILIISFVLISCGSTTEYDFDPETAAIDITVEDSSQKLSPRLVVSETGNITKSIYLKKGTYLVNLNYKLSVDSLNQKDSAYITLRRDAKIISNISSPIEDDSFKQIYIDQDSKYILSSYTPYSTDEWKLTFVHKEQLNIDLESKLMSAPINSSEGEDILYKYQWHLNNTAQSFPNGNIPPELGNDINVTSVWSDGTTGKGVSVAIVDEGVEINHPDLIDNIDIKSSWNYINKSHDTTPDLNNTFNSHGTAVAGIVAASWKNGIGGRGVAPEATLVSYNMIEAQGVTNFPLVLSILVDKEEDNISIFNNSWGLALSGEYDNGGNDCSVHELPNFSFVLDNKDLLLPTSCNPEDLHCQFENQLRNGVQNGRNTKGYIYVKSAGNSRLCTSSINEGYSDVYMNSNYYPDQVERFMIVVGASKADGILSRYSTPGENVFINAPGGASQLSYIKPNEGMIVTTDLTSSHRGYDFNINNDDKIDSAHFNVIGNENYDFTDRMNGTSAAGPIVSGVIALMLQTNPSLTWRDVKYILSKSATKNPDVSNYRANGVGILFSSEYGFGRVNAGKAVELSKTWSNLSIEKFEKSSRTTSTAFFNGVKSVATNNISMAEDLLVEYINLEFGIDTTINEFENLPFTDDNNEFSIDGGTYVVEFSIDGVIESNTSGGSITGSNSQIDLKVLQNGVLVANIATIQLSNGEGTYTGSVTLAKHENTQIFVETTDTNVTLLSGGNFECTLTRGDNLLTSGFNLDLESPSGTVSPLLITPNYDSVNDRFYNYISDSNSTNIRMRMGSNRFLDEHSNGVWKIRLTDTSNKNTKFLLKDVKLEVYGR